MSALARLVVPIDNHMVASLKILEMLHGDVTTQARDLVSSELLEFALKLRAQGPPPDGLDMYEQQVQSAGQTTNEALMKGLMEGIPYCFRPYVADTAVASDDLQTVRNILSGLYYVQNRSTENAAELSSSL